MSGRRLALLTIGQSPRTDVLSDVLPLLSGVDWLEEGALDGLTYREVERYAPGAGEEVLVSRMRDGSGVRIRHDCVGELIHDALIRAHGRGAEAALLMCTGHIALRPGPIPVSYGEELAHSRIASAVGGLRVGVLAPLEEQCEEISARWCKRLATAVCTASADPYTASEAELRGAAAELVERGAQAIVLDCFGYSRHMADVVRDETSCPVWVTRCEAVAAFVGAHS